MEEHRLYAFNLTRQAFLSLSVRLADTHWARLRGLADKLKPHGDDGVWVVPSMAIHTFGLFFPIDVIYLDAQMRVIHLIEHLGPLRIASVRPRCASVLQLPVRSIFGSGTQVGDEIAVCSPEQIHTYWETKLEAHLQVSRR